MGKVSLPIAIRQGLVGPKKLVRTYIVIILIYVSKGNQVNIPELMPKKGRLQNRDLLDYVRSDFPKDYLSLLTVKESRFTGFYGHL